MQQDIKRFGKPILIAGLCLSGLLVFEAKREIVDALELHHPAPMAQAQQPAVPPTTAPLAAPLKTQSGDRAKSTSSQPTAQSTAPSTAKSVALDFGVQSQSKIAHQQTIALNEGQANDPRQPVSQLTATQVGAVGGWHGASFPVENFEAYTSPFGYRVSATGGASQEFHYGLDMAAPEGSYIRNWWTGKVVEVTDNTNCGTSVVVESGSWTHIYCHMEGHVEESNGQRSMIDREGGIQIVEGQTVPAGARIGRVGMSGRTTGPHLHWGLKYSGNWVDPALVLRAMYASQQQTVSQAGN